MGAVLAVLKAIQMLGECDDQDYNALSPSDSHADGNAPDPVVVNPTPAGAGGVGASVVGGGGTAVGAVTGAGGSSQGAAPEQPSVDNGATSEPRPKDGDISISSLLGNIDDLDDFPFNGTGNASTPGGGSVGGGAGGGGGGSTPGGGRTPGGGNGANTPAKTGSTPGAPDALAIGAAASFMGGVAGTAGGGTGGSGSGGATASTTTAAPAPPQKSDIGSLTEFAKLVLRTMCGQEWVRERCLQDPESLFQQQHLLDPCLSQSQTRHLLHLICYPGW